LDKIGFVDNITKATTLIDAGRKGYATKGKAEEGRRSYEIGISVALSAFRDAQSTIDPQTIILVEYTFLSQELQFCEKTDTDTLSSLSLAVQSFDDAFLVLEAVEDTGYKIVDKAFPHNGKYRVNSFPKDSFHIACIAHRTRLQNILRAPGIDFIEKALLKQRYINLATAQSGYLEMQEKVLGGGS